MRLSIVTFMYPGPEPRGQSLERIANYVRRVEAAGFPGSGSPIRWAAGARPSIRS